MEDSPLWKDPTFVSIAKQAAIYLGLLILLLLVINKVIKPAIQTMNNSLASPPSSQQLLASVGADESEQKALPDPSRQNELRLNQVRNLAQQDPRAVAEVVKQWVGKNE